VRPVAESKATGVLAEIFAEIRQTASQFVLARRRFDRVVVPQRFGENAPWPIRSLTTLAQGATAGNGYGRSLNGEAAFRHRVAARQHALTKGSIFRLAASNRRGLI
jgi:hypothetical protein